MKQEPDQTAGPQWEQDRIDQHALIEDERQGSARDVAPAAPDVAHQLKEWEIMADQPGQVGENNQECGECADPHPAASRETGARGTAADPRPPRR